MSLATIDQSLKDLSPEDLRTLAQRFAAELARVQRPNIRKLELFVTEDCNLRCDYCWVPKNPRCMSLDTAKRAIDFVLDDCGQAEKVAVTLFGGEPLLEFDLVRQIMGYAMERASALGKRIGWAMTTNGTLLSPRVVEFCLRRGLKFLLSVDGCRESHDIHRKFADGKGSFDEIVKWVPMLKRTQGWLGARMTLTPTNVHLLAQGVTTLVEQGVNQFLIGRDLASPWTAGAIHLLQEQWVAVGEAYQRLRAARRPVRLTVFEKDSRHDADKSDWWGCEAGRDKIAVMPSGDIYPCSRFIDKAGIQRTFWLGHVDVGLVAERTRQQLTDDRDVIRYKCMKCAHRNTCMGGCPATNYLCTGSPYIPPKIDCEMHTFWERLRHERPEFWAASEIPYGAGKGNSDECVGDGRLPQIRPTR
ncbi:MAG TPA: radical SAM protein [Armatimonadota bacterium]|nr:radical SAM protein [Armatimonadota bacterium]